MHNDNFNSAVFPLLNVVHVIEHFFVFMIDHIFRPDSLCRYMTPCMLERVSAWQVCSPEDLGEHRGVRD